MARISRRAVSSLSLLSVVVLTPLAAQEAPDLVTDRPDQTESAVVLPQGAFQAEAGVTFTHDDERGVKLEALESPGTLLRYGLGSRFELRLAWPGEVELEATTPAGKLEIDGAADPELGFKWSLLARDRGDALDLGLLVNSTLPVGSEEVGAPSADPSVRLLVAHELSDRLALGWNVGYESASFEDEARIRHTLSRFVYTASLGVSLADRWGTFVEVYGDLPASDPEPAAHSFDAGITFLATPSLQLDLAGGIGLNDAAPDWFIGAGVSYRCLRRTPKP
jgi:hypothetical protein